MVDRQSIETAPIPLPPGTPKRIQRNYEAKMKRRKNSARFAPERGFLSEFYFCSLYSKSADASRAWNALVCRKRWLIEPETVAYQRDLRLADFIARKVSAMRILLIEDDEGIAEMVADGLKEAHFTVDVAPDGVTGLELLTCEIYSLLVLDLMLPGMDGWSVCRRLRTQRNPIPILMLTARNTVEDRIAGLEIGADDYLSKPFDFGELLARIRALLRRDKSQRACILRVGDLEVDTRHRHVTRAGKEISLTLREYTLLEALAAHEGQILSRELIQEHIWLDEESYSNTVDVHIAQLRKKIDAGHPVKLIHTVYGFGYALKNPSHTE